MVAKIELFVSKDLLYQLFFLGHYFFGLVIQLAFHRISCLNNHWVAPHLTFSVMNARLELVGLL